MNVASCRCSSVAELHDLASRLAKTLPSGVLIGLSGPLGVGKTEFVRGFCHAARVSDGEVTSPTFILEQRYSCDRSELSFTSVSHWDLYRLVVGNELGDSQAELLDSVKSDTVVFAEWPERCLPIMERLSALIRFEVREDEARFVTLEVYDLALQVRLKQLLSTL